MKKNSNRIPCESGDVYLIGFPFVTYHKQIIQRKACKFNTNRTLNMCIFNVRLSTHFDSKYIRKECGKGDIDYASDKS